MSAEAAALPAYPRLPPGLKPLLLLVGVAAAVAAGVMVVLWSRGPTYSMLFANLASEDQAQIVQALESAGIPYRLDPHANAISVPAERLSEARLKLAGDGLPESGGFALLSRESGFGVSQFMEGARYQHALESELARTIASLRPVEGARVHLAVPRQSAFVRDRRAPSASVFVQLKPGRRLEQEQVRAIVNLVAASIPDLEPSAVTVVDQQGHLLSAPQTDSELAQREAQFEMARRLEAEFAARIEALLTPFVGPGRVRAQVVAQIDTSVREEAREQYSPDGQVVRSEQSTEQITRDGGPEGVPGALTNQPPAGGVAQPPGAPANTTQVASATGEATTQTQAPVSSSRSTTRNFEIDRTLAYTRQPAGRLQRLTVAVLIDNLRTTAEDGTVKVTPLTPEQIEHITTLVKDAVGFNAERGDSVNVINAPFIDEPVPEVDELEEVPFWQQPIVLTIAKLVAGLIVLLILIFSVLRPLVRGLLTHSRQAITQVIPATVETAAPPPGARPAYAGATVSPANQPLAYEQQLAQARTMVTQDPKRVAQVVRTWVSEDE